MDSIREEDIDEMHNLDIQQVKHDMYCPISGEFNCIRHACMWYFDEPPMKGCHYQDLDADHSKNEFYYASSAGRKQTGAATLSPPSMRNSSSRLPKKQKGSHFDMPSKSESNPSVSPYPPVRYTWEIE